MIRWDHGLVSFLYARLCIDRCPRRRYSVQAIRRCPAESFRTDDLSTTASAVAKPQSFAALRHPGYRAYLTGNALAMMADSVEHAITYWVAFQKFHSPTLGGFAMLSHWLPFLLFSTLSGALADRFDPRRLVQIGMVLFMFCSLTWSVLILTDSLQMWEAAVLLIIH